MTHKIPYNNPKPPPPVTVGITMGDPCGIGPEIIIKALNDVELINTPSSSSVANNIKYVIYGLNNLLLQTAESLNIKPDWHTVNAYSKINLKQIEKKIIVVDLQTRLTNEIDWTQPTPTAPGGQISITSINQAINAALLPETDTNHINAVVTAPISKTSWKLNGITNYPGHTELFAARTRTKHYAMMFVAPELNVALATTHIPLMKIVPDYLTKNRILEVIKLVNQTCIKHFNIKNPRIAVCGLNPHASENGIFGNEEKQIIIPAIQQAVKNAGIKNTTGPYPPDTVFNDAVYNNKFDAVVAMYHDQATIPIKLLARDKAVNVTIGLPIIRTSPDHGTAFDIAGKNLANPGSMIAAIKLAAKMALIQNQQ